LILIDRILSPSQSHFLSKYISASKDDQDQIIKKLVLINNEITDDMLVSILQGIKDQSMQIRALEYSSNKLSEKSLPLIFEIIAHLNELKLSNLKLNDNIKVMQRLIHQVEKRGTFLMKVQISNINLNDD
jgi:hypothetical protein